MEKIITILNSIKSEKNKEKIIKLLPSIHDEINNILQHIKKCDNVTAAYPYFGLLEEIQSYIATLIFKEHITISDELWKFFKDFDRIDDEDERKFLFNLIKNNQYSLSSTKPIR